MREIKFRAWSKEDKKMRYHAEQAANGHWQMNDINYFYQLLDNPKYDLMQYTGFNDEIGKEIYEGDILNVNGDHKEVWYRDGAFMCGDDYIYYQVTGNGCSVVGTIYENSELIKKI